ncbi:MAG: hypothetical protein AAFN94_14610 [Pseudomonadota bacterium]
MADTVFVHRRAHRNVGDHACSPGAYVDLGPHRFVDFGADAGACDLAVLGGGQVFQDCVTYAIYRAAVARRVVVWGVGLSDKDRRSLEFDILAGRAALISTRNVGVTGVDYVPCASTLSPLLDAPPAPIHDVVLFSHAKKSGDLRRDAGVPEMANDVASMAEAVAFLASGATVVTNSYHGALWAMCLGRRVLMVPFSDKFRHFPENPPEAGPRDWVNHVDRAEARADLLADARARNNAFYDKVRNLSAV